MMQNDAQVMQDKFEEEVLDRRTRIMAGSSVMVDNFD
jgi:hypothetical protein